MDAQAEQYFLGLLLVAMHAPSRVPSPMYPPDEVSERAADDYIRWLMHASEMRSPSPDAACALIPRLQMVEAFGSYVEPRFQQHCESIGVDPGPDQMIEWFLITYWRSYWRARWLAGVLE